MTTGKADTTSRSGARAPLLARTALSEQVPLSTMIGSMPHHNIDAALAASFQVDVPFLPQIPIRNPWEFMIAQALEGMPGLSVENDGSTTLDLSVWTGRAHAMNERLLAAFAASPARRDAFESFEPSAATSSGWQPFLYELHEKGSKLAKVQIAGPITAQWVLRLNDGTSASRLADVTSQIYRLVLARAMAMSRRLQADGIQPIIYFDEPGLYGFMPTDPKHLVALQELKLVVQTLSKDGALVGIHCCSDTHWASVLSLGLDYVSIDTELSLKSLLSSAEALEAYLVAGGRLSLGVISTTKLHEDGAFNAGAILERLLDEIAKSPLGRKPELVRQMLRNALYTPACGLALHPVADAERVLASLLEFTRLARRTFSP